MFVDVFGHDFCLALLAGRFAAWTEAKLCCTWTGCNFVHKGSMCLLALGKDTSKKWHDYVLYI